MKPTPERTKSGKIVWRVKFLVAKRRVRKTFLTRERAREWIAENADIAKLKDGRSGWHGGP
jgi:hypothetical protein